MRMQTIHYQHQTTEAAAQQAGFTIVELMIATLVSSIILIVVTFGIVHFTSDYYKGINSSNTQAAAQNAVDTITQALEFGTVIPTATGTVPGAFCAGSQLFLYSTGAELTGSPTPANPGLYQIDNPSANCSIPSGLPTPLSGGTELLGKNMRLTTISLTQQNGLWNLALRVAYGDSDLLCRSGLPSGTQGSCGQGSAAFATSANVAGGDVYCKSQTGSQFCSIAQLNTAIEQRVSN